MKKIDFSESKQIIVPGDLDETLDYCVKDLIHLAKKSIASHGFFALALSGGNTPKLIYQRLSTSSEASSVDWSKVLLFWSDERSVLPHHPDSNFRMAMQAGGLAKLPLQKEHIFRMVAENEIEHHAASYEQLILEKLNRKPFDCIMLGMGSDGHTASLFPNTSALEETDKLVVANHVPQQNTWRMTMTYPCINQAIRTRIYVFGASKAQTVHEVLHSDHPYPIQKIGTALHPATWILDKDAAKLLFEEP